MNSGCRIAVTGAAVVAAAALAAGCGPREDANTVAIKVTRAVECVGKNGLRAGEPPDGALSDEQFVSLAYRTILLRDPDPLGLAGHCSLLREHKVTRKELVGALAGSEEFKNLR